MIHPLETVISVVSQLLEEVRDVLAFLDDHEGLLAVVLPAAVFGEQRVLRQEEPLLADVLLGLRRQPKRYVRAVVSEIGAGVGECAHSQIILL